MLSDSQVDENEEFMDAILMSPETSTQSSHVIMVDKEIDAVKKVKSCRTQYSLLDIGINEAQVRTEVRSPLLVKFSKRTTKEFGCNTDISFRPNDNVDMSCINDIEEVSTDEEVDDKNDESFTIEEESEHTEEKMETGDEEAFDKFLDSNFIINWSCLFSLFKFCSVCYQSVKVKDATTKGTLLIVNLICVNNHSSQWLSQPRFRRQGSGNLLLSASVLFSGNTYQRIKEMMDIAKISF